MPDLQNINRHSQENNFNMMELRTYIEQTFIYTYYWFIYWTASVV
jgi:hypothetical protein